MNKTKQFKIQTPIGSVESDSGSHVVDILSVVGIIVLCFVLKKLFGK